MYSFFVPISKVQKDRQIIRETDSRMAKYSRRGLIINFLAFLLCLYGGRFAGENIELTIVLTTGLLLITIVRGFFVFRFDQIYPRAPNKWRNYYFTATLAGACWWSLIMCSITLQLEMQNEAPLFWFYTIVFFSTTAHAFAPYQNFLSTYQLIGQIPAALAALYIGTLESSLYAGVLIGFYFVLNHQCRLMSENYWERLEVTYAYTRKTISLEEEKKDSRTSSRLNSDFLQFLVKDFKKAMESDAQAPKAEFQNIYKNVADFQKIVAKTLELNSHVFNIRHELQHIVAIFVDKAEADKLSIETSLSPSLPMRLKGDSKRLGEIIKNLIDISLRQLEDGLVLVEAEFIREYERAGELYLTVSVLRANHSSLFQQKSLSKDMGQENLEYIIGEGLASSMDGSLEKIDIPKEGFRYRFNAKMSIADIDGQVDFHRNFFSGHTVLLVHSEAAIVDIKRQELEALGFTVMTETQYKRAVSILLSSAKQARPIEAVVFYFEGDGVNALGFAETLDKLPELNFVRQLLAVSGDQRRQIRQNQTLHENIFLVDKPMGLFELESTFHKVYKDYDGADTILPEKAAEGAANPSVIHSFSNSSAVNASINKLLLDSGIHVRTFSHPGALVESLQELPKVILLDLVNAEETRQLAQLIREAEIASAEETLVPILGVYVKGEIVEAAFELGLDDTVDIRMRQEDAINTIRYWASLQ